MFSADKQLFTMFFIYTLTLKFINILTSQYIKNGSLQTFNLIFAALKL
jgi:hypothetical protein